MDSSSVLRQSTTSLASSVLLRLELKNDKMQVKNKHGHAAENYTKIVRGGVGAHLPKREDYTIYINSTGVILADLCHLRDEFAMLGKAASAKRIITEAIDILPAEACSTVKQ